MTQHRFYIMQGCKFSDFNLISDFFTSTPLTTIFEISTFEYTWKFLENNFKYQNARNNEFGGTISANYRGFFTISCLLFDIFKGVMAP